MNIFGFRNKQEVICVILFSLTMIGPHCGQSLHKNLRERTLLEETDASCLKHMMFQKRFVSYG